MKIYVTDFDGVEHECEAIEGWRVMEIIRDYGLPIKAECGGACLCGTCHVYVAPEWIEDSDRIRVRQNRFYKIHYLIL
jgi:2Fe-2S ferredoxin